MITVLAVGVVENAIIHCFPVLCSTLQFIFETVKIKQSREHFQNWADLRGESGPVRKIWVQHIGGPEHMFFRQIIFCADKFCPFDGLAQIHRIATYAKKSKRFPGYIFQWKDIFRYAGMAGSADAGIINCVLHFFLAAYTVFPCAAGTLDFTAEGAFVKVVFNESIPVFLDVSINSVNGYLVMMCFGKVVKIVADTICQSVADIKITRHCISPSELSCLYWGESTKSVLDYNIFHKMASAKDIIFLK